ncbi:2029_t:CDS:2, partial [Funneliformis geosporum]
TVDLNVARSLYLITGIQSDAAYRLGHFLGLQIDVDYDGEKRFLMRIALYLKRSYENWTMQSYVLAQSMELFLISWIFLGSTLESYGIPVTSPNILISVREWDLYRDNKMDLPDIKT